MKGRQQRTRRVARALPAVAAVFLLAGCMFVPPEEEAPISLSLDGRSLVWADEFDAPGTGNSPDTSKWSYQTGAGGWGNAEVQTYTTNLANAYVENGCLNVSALKDGSGNWTSARLRTIDKGDWTYGYMEARIRLPAANGAWPAFWMLPSQSAYGDAAWPDNGEIDIMEYSPVVVGVNKVFATVHYGDSHLYSSLANVAVSSATTAFHRYGVAWDRDSITWYLDGVKQGDTYTRHGDWTVWPFNQDFHFLLNVAMGGNLGGIIDSGLTTATMEVDYVRVYQ